MAADIKTVDFTPANSSEAGYLIPIGGAERKRRNPEVLKKFVELSGGSDANIVIIPTASRVRSTGERYERVFLSLGADVAKSLLFKNRKDCSREDWLDILEDATGIFLTGGSQLRLSSTLGGTPVADTIRRLHAAGTNIAGTSAGASYLSEHMIAFGDSGASPSTHKVALVPGIGLTRDFIIDQHFRERDRLGRLLTALAYNPRVLGLGLDEDTAAFIGPDSSLEVVGSGTCTILDGSEVGHSSMGHDLGDPVSLHGVRLHVLTAGSRYFIDSRQPLAPDEAFLDEADPTPTPAQGQR